MPQKPQTSRQELLWRAIAKAMTPTATIQAALLRSFLILRGQMSVFLVVTGINIIHVAVRRQRAIARV